MADAQHRTAAQPQATEPEQQVDRLVEHRMRELSALATHLQQLAEVEKSQIARTLHDELGGLLTAAKMDLSWLQPRITAPELQERLTQLGSVLDEAMDLKRRVVDDLRPSLLDHFGLPTALRSHFGAVCSKAGLRADIDIIEDAQSMAKDTAIILFRVLQEGLSNITRHAQAKNVRLTIIAEASCAGPPQAGPRETGPPQAEARQAVEPRCYEVTLSDDGRGFDTRNPQLDRSPGFMGMRQRVHALRGSLNIDSTAGRGTILTLKIPLQ